MSPDKWVIFLNFCAAIIGTTLTFLVGLCVYAWGYRTALRDMRAAATPERDTNTATQEGT